MTSQVYEHLFKEWGFKPLKNVENAQIYANDLVRTGRSQFICEVPVCSVFQTDDALLKRGPKSGGERRLIQTASNFERL